MARRMRWVLPLVLVLTTLGLAAPGQAAADTALAGTVYNSDGVPLPGVTVLLLNPWADLNGGFQAGATTDSAGHYEFSPLESLDGDDPVHPWVLTVIPPQDDQRSEVFHLDITRGVTNTFDVHLARQFLVSGTVLPSPGETSRPSGRIFPQLFQYREDLDTWQPGGSEDETYDAETGAYSVRTVPGTYRLCFSAGSAGPQGCDGANHVENANDLVVTSTLSGHDVPLGTFGTISGRVGWVGHPAISLASVNAHVSRNPAGGPNSWVDVNTSIRVGTDADGRYATRVLAGTYHVRFDTVDDGNVPHYYPEGRPDEASADDVVVQPDTTTVVDTELDIDRPALVNTVPPTLPGAPVSGQPYTVAHGTWVASNGARPPLTYSYTWTRDDGKLLAEDAPSPTYTPTVDDEGHRLQVTVRAVALGYLRTGVLVDAPAVVARGIVNLVQPSIAGTPTTAMTVSARNGTWSPGGLTFGYQWLDNEVPIDGATARSFTIPGSMLSHRLGLQVTASRPGMKAVTATVTSVVSRTEIRNTTPPTLTGRPAVGSTLTGHAGTWTPTGSTRAPFHWYADGVIITGATSWTFAPTAAQLGKVVTFRVRVTFPTTAAVYGDTAGSAPIVPGTITAPTPQVTGSPTVGSTLTATAGATKPATTTIRYQWYRGATAITGATSSTYVPTAADTGRRVKVVIAHSATGYTSITRTSAPTAPVT